MFGKIWYHQLIRKYVICVGTIFSDISIIRTVTVDPTTDTTQLIKVPITYAPKEKMMVRIMQDPDIDRPSATTTLPTISFEMGKITYDPSRKMNSMGKIQLPASGATAGTIGTPVPYNINFKVYVYVKNTEDGTKIIEQILPCFGPTHTISAALVPEMGINMDIPITLDAVDYEDTYTGDFKTRRAIIWTLSLTLKGYFFGPVKHQTVIKFAQTNMYTATGFDSLCAAVGNVSADEVYTIQPGLTYSGQPTSNLALSIPYQQINANDDFGYIESTYNP
jgi:hypothetical protein